MILWTVKFFFFFCVCFAVLSIPVNNRPLFSYIYSETKPYTETALEKTKENAEKAVRGTASFGKQIFKNAAPEVSSNDETTESTVTTQVKAAAENVHTEVYSKEEVQQLKKILEEN